MKKLTSSFEIKTAMGKEMVDYIKKNDPATKSVSRNSSIGKRILNKYGDCCIICGRKKSKIEIEIAHICPVEEGGMASEDSLIPLCSQKKTKLGCHQLYDNGYLSRNKLREIVKKASSGNVCSSSVRQNMIKASKLREEGTLRPLPKNVKVPKIGHEAFLHGHTKSINKLKTAAKEALKNRDFKSEFFCRLRLAEFLRRGCGSNALEKALRQIKRCEELLNEVSELYHSRFYYEYGYIYHLLGNSKQAISAFKCAAEAARNTKDRIGETEEIILLLHDAWIEILNFPLRGAEAINGLKPIEKQLFNIEKKSRLLKSAIGNRWATICIVYQAHLNIKTCRVAKAKEFFLKATNFIDLLDATSGWGNWAPSILRTGLFIGILNKNKKWQTDGYHRHLVGMCCRALIMLLGNKANRPEGIKDIIIALRLLLEKEKKPRNEFINRLLIVEKNVHDPSSGLL